MRYFSREEHPRDGKWHVWPSVSIESPSDSMSYVTGDGVAYCGLGRPEAVSHQTFAIDPKNRDNPTIREWAAWLAGDGNDKPPVGRHSNVCAECAYVFHKGLHTDADWQRAFRTEHDLPGGVA